jgi:hypothetical protein
MLDPRWQEQRKIAEARYATTFNTADVANNLKRFASQRDDIYEGATGFPISAEGRGQQPLMTDSQILPKMRLVYHRCRARMSISSSSESRRCMVPPRISKVKSINYGVSTKPPSILRALFQAWSLAKTGCNSPFRWILRAWCMPGPPNQAAQIPVLWFSFMCIVLAWSAKD